MKTTLIVILSLWILPFQAALAQKQSPAQAWQIREAAELGLLADAGFANVQNGWAVGIRSISHTINGGRDWGAQRNPDQPAMWFNSVAALSPEGAMVAGFPYGRPGAGVLLRTKDGGKSWKPVVAGNETASYHSLAFRRDSKTGFLISSTDGLMKTQDGGLTWKTVETPHGVTRSFVAVRGRIALPDDKTIYVGGDLNVLLHSGDDGATWEKIEMPAEAASPHGQFMWVRFADAKVGWVAPLDNGSIWETRDGGQGWEKSAAPGPPAFAYAKTGWAIGTNQVWRTSDGGATWIEKADPGVPQGIKLTALTLTSKRVFVVGGEEGTGRAFVADRLLPGVEETRAEEAHAPIPIRFKLAEAGVVTLVVEDKDGRRVRNLPDRRLHRASDQRPERRRNFPDEGRRRASRRGGGTG